MLDKILERLVGVAYLLILIIAFWFSYQYYLSKRNHSKYEVYNERMVVVGYANDLKIGQDGCLKTNDGTVCGTFSTRLNPYYQ
jgi:hypothetical protein